MPQNLPSSVDSAEHTIILVDTRTIKQRNNNNTQPRETNRSMSLKKIRWSTHGGPETKPGTLSREDFQLVVLLSAAVTIHLFK